MHRRKRWGEEEVVSLWDPINLMMDIEMKIRYLICLALLNTVSSAHELLNFEVGGVSSTSHPLNVEILKEEKSLSQKRQILLNHIRPYYPKISNNAVLVDLVCMALKVNNAILFQQNQRVESQVQLLTVKVGRKKSKLDTQKSQFDSKQEEFQQLQGRISSLERQVETLTRGQRQDQSAILTLQQQLEVAHKNFNDKNLELTQLQDRHTDEARELQQQIRFLVDEKEYNQETLAKISHQLQTANNKINAKEEEFVSTQSDYSQQTQSLQQHIAALIKQRESDHQALGGLKQKLQMATKEIKAKEEELEQIRQHYGQLMQRVKELTVNQRYDQQALGETQTQLDTATNQLKVKEEEFAQAKEKHGEESKKLETQISNLIKTNQENQQILIEIQGQLESTRQEILDKQREWDTIQQGHTEQVNNLHEQLRELRASTDIKQQKIDELQAQLKTAENKILEVEHQLDEAQEIHTHQVHSLQEKIKELTEVLDKKQKMLEEQQTQLNDVKEELQEKELEFTTARKVQENKIYSLKEKVESLREFIDVQQQESSKQLTQAENKILETRFQLEETQHHLETIRSKYRKLIEASDLQQQDLKEHEIRLEQAQAKILETEQKLAKTQETYIRQVQALEDQVKGLIGLNDSKQARIEEQEVQLKQAESKILETEQELVKTQENYILQVQELEGQVEDLTELNDSKQHKIEEQEVQLKQAESKILETEQHLVKTQETYTLQVQELEGQVKDLHGLNVAQQQQLNLQQVQLEQLTNQNYELEKAYTTEKQTSNKWKQMFLEAQKKLREQEEKFQSFVHFIKDATVKVEAGKENIDPNLSPLSSPRRSSPCSPNRALSPRPVNNTPNGVVRSLFLTVNGQ